MWSRKGNWAGWSESDGWRAEWRAGGTSYLCQSVSQLSELQRGGLDRFASQNCQWSRDRRQHSTTCYLTAQSREL